MKGQIIVESREAYDRRPGMRQTPLKKAYSHSCAHAALSLESDIRTEALDRGNAWHTLVLEPAEFDARYFVSDGPTNPTTGKPYGYDTQKYKEWKALDEFAGKELITTAEFRNLSVSSNVIRQNPVVSHLLADSKKEVTLIWDEDLGPCKARLDILSNDGIVADLKSTRNAAPTVFSREVHRYDRLYWIQAAWYFRAATQCGVEVKEFLFIAAELFAPYAMSLHYYEPDQLQEMFHEIYPYAEQFAEQQITGKYDGYPQVKSMLSVPNFMSAGEDEDNG